MNYWVARLAAWGASGAAVLGGLVPTAQAQTPDVQLAPSRAVECLTPPAAQRGTPEYPFAPWKRGEGGRVLVELSFGGPDLEPAVNVLEHAGDAELVQAVKTHVATLRVPCADSGDLPVRLRQDYVFIPDQRKAVWGRPTDLADAERERALGCLAAHDGSKSPRYPDWARRIGAQGRVLAKLRFTAPDRPPEVTLFAASLNMQRLSREAVLPWAAKLRLPCMESTAVEAMQVFIFRMEGDPAYGFKDIGFVPFLRGAKNLEQPGALFDTTAMGCPFDVRLSYRQPFLPNAVGQLGDALPARQPLLDWLSTLVLDLKDAQQDAVLGDTATLTVPCAKIDFNPKEKSS